MRICFSFTRGSFELFDIYCVSKSLILLDRLQCQLWIFPFKLISGHIGLPSKSPPSGSLFFGCLAGMTIVQWQCVQQFPFAAGSALNPSLCPLGWTSIGLPQRIQVCCSISVLYFFMLPLIWGSNDPHPFCFFAGIMDSIFDKTLLLPCLDIPLCSSPRHSVLGKQVCLKGSGRICSD